MRPSRVEFRGWTCRVERASYGQTDRIALPLYAVEDHSLVAMGTVNLPEFDLSADEVLIKDYSENEGMLALLVEAEVVSSPHAWVRSGYVTLYLCRCLI